MPGRAPSLPYSHEPFALTGLAVLVLVGVLAEVPDVAVLVLGVPVVRVLGELAVDVHGVAHDGRGDALDHAGLVEHLHLDPLGLAVLLALVHPPHAGREGQVRVVDHVHEVGRIELGRVAAAVAGVDDGLGRLVVVVVVVSAVVVLVVAAAGEQQHATGRGGGPASAPRRRRHGGPRFLAPRWRPPAPSSPSAEPLLNAAPHVFSARSGSADQAGARRSP